MMASLCMNKHLNNMQLPTVCRQDEIDSCFIHRKAVLVRKKREKGKKNERRREVKQ